MNDKERFDVLLALGKACTIVVVITFVIALIVRWSINYGL